jgi:hypothetical protein
MDLVMVAYFNPLNFLLYCVTKVSHMHGSGLIQVVAKVRILIFNGTGSSSSVKVRCLSLTINIPSMTSLSKNGFPKSIQCTDPSQYPLGTSLLSLGSVPAAAGAAAAPPPAIMEVSPSFYYDAADANYAGLISPNSSLTFIHN